MYNRKTLGAALGFGCLALAVAGAFLLVLVKGHPSYETTVSNFTYEVVSDSAAQELGLGGRTDVPHNYGMLFTFPKDDEYGFWMKDMSVPIDIVWLSDNGTIIKIDAEVATSTYPSVFYPPEPVRYVLETRSGEAAAQGWEVGTQLQTPFTN